MASFTDQISQFNPYIQQLPVQLMAEVGQQREAQYNQGVQKIQTQVDNVAGMDVMKGEHKEYLQSQLDELGNNLKMVAAGDFSNQQLVNSVGGMATSIIKDPIIQNAVYSTQVARKGDADMEAAIKAGKSSKDNEDYWNNQKSQWLNDGNLKSTFNGRYTEFTDTDKKLRDFAKEVTAHPDKYGVEIPYKRDDAGNVLYYGTKQVKDPKTGKTIIQQTTSTDPSKGEKKIDDDMLAINIEGTSAEKLYNGFMDTLDSNDLQQLHINAWAKYRGYGPEMFKQEITALYDGKKKMQDQQIINLAVELKNSDLTSVQKAKLQAKLTDLNNQSTSGLLDKEQNATLAAIDNPANLEKYKDQLYTQNHLLGLATDLSYKSYEQAYKDNPLFQAYMKKQELNLSYKKFADESARGWENINLTKQRFAWEKNKDQRDWEEKHPEEVVVPGALPTNAPVPTITTAEQDVKGTETKITELQNKFGDRLFSDIVDKDPEKQSAKRTLAFAKLASQYRQNPNMNMTSDQRKYLEDHRNLENDLTSQQNLVNYAKKKGLEYVQNQYNAKIGGVAGFTGSEIADVVQNLQKFYTRDEYRGGTRFDDQSAINYFKTYQGGKYSSLANAFAKDKTLKLFESLNPQEKEMVNALNKAKPIVQNVIGNELNKYTTDILTQHSPKSVIQREGLNPETDKNKAAAIEKFISLKLAQKGDVSGAEMGGDPATVAGWRTQPDANKMTWVLEKSRDGSAQAVVTSPDGSNKVILKMKPEEEALFPELLKGSPFNNIKPIVLTSPTYTTNAANIRGADPANAVTAKYSGYDLPQLKNDPLAPLIRLDVEGDWDNTGAGGGDGYNLNLYVQDPKTKHWKGKTLNASGYATEGGVVSMLNAISKDAINEAIKTFK